MAIDDLLRHLEAEAGAEAERILADAAREAREIEERAAAEAGRRRRAGEERLGLEAAAAIRRALGSAERAARRRVLVARAGAVDRVFAEAERQLSALPIKRYRDRLPALVTETLSFLERGAVLVFHADAADVVAEQVGDRAAVRLEPSPAATPGVLGRSEDGSVVVDNTFLARLSRRRAELAIPVARRLDGDDDAVR